ncbi:MAG: prepilin-type N-terminal cleavage/methylation domain-containing protein [Desulfobacteraceae bacterium]|nr:prepilin-type N-terminal cleavage/methylation domain-containing protein [Desulfobacteraceae bacterium]
MKAATAAILSRAIRGHGLRSGGFTLIELILATTISALVIGILSVCLSFALRAWESTQNRQVDQTTLMVDLIKLQLSELDPTPIRSEGSVHPVFRGNSSSLYFVSGHSVKAISHGVPVVVRYAYDARKKLLSYSERPFDPYHAKAIEDFSGAGKGRETKDRPPSYEIEMPAFSLSYAGRDATQFSDRWEKSSEIPIEVLLRWTGEDAREHSRMLMVNCPFAISVKKEQAPAARQGGSAFE